MALSATFWSCVLRKRRFRARAYQLIQHHKGRAMPKPRRGNCQHIILDVKNSLAFSTGNTLAKVPSYSVFTTTNTF